MTLVIDASAVISALTDSGPEGDWARSSIRGERLLAPTILHYEVANAFRRHQKADQLAPAEASAAFDDLLSLAIRLVPFRFTAERAWSLRENFTIADASYIAAAEVVGFDLLTLDVRLTRGPKVDCRFRTYLPSGD